MTIKEAIKKVIDLECHNDKCEKMPSCCGCPFKVLIDVARSYEEAERREVIKFFRDVYAERDSVGYDNFMIPFEITQNELGIVLEALQAMEERKNDL